MRGRDPLPEADRPLKLGSIVAEARGLSAVAPHGTVHAPLVVGLGTGHAGAPQPKIRYRDSFGSFAQAFSSGGEVVKFLFFRGQQIMHFYKLISWDLAIRKRLFY